MALLFVDGFEAADQDRKWDLSIATSSTTTRFGVGRSVIITSGNVMSKTIPASSTVTVGFASMTGSGSPQIGFAVSFYGDNASTQHLTVMRSTTTGLVQVRRGSTSGTLIATGTKGQLEQCWNYFEIQVTISDTVGTVKVRIDGNTVEDIDFSGDTKNGGTNNTIDRIWFYGASLASVYYDDLYILDGTGAVNNTFLGDIRVQSLVPTADATYNQFVGSDGNSTNNYQLVAEQPFSTNDYVSSSTPGEKDSYTFSDLLGDTTTVFGLQGNMVGYKADAGSANARQFVRIGGTDYAGATNPLGANWSTTFTEVRDQNPATAANWTVSDVNGIEAGSEVM